LALDHVSVADPPRTINDGLTVIVKVGGAAGVTVRGAEPDALPPRPETFKVYLNVPEVVGATTSVPYAAFDPDQESAAVMLVALVVDHVIVAELP
jgi:hypothetical protein